MAGRCGEDEWLFVDGGDVEQFVRDGQAEKAGVEASVFELRDLVGAADVHQLQCDLRVLAAEGENDGGDQIDGGGGDEADAEVAGFSAGDTLGAEFGVAEQVEDGGGVAMQGFTGGSEGYAAAIAEKKLDAELGLKLLDMRGESGLGEMQEGCGAREVEGVGDGEEGLEMAQFHT
jgi:hypothetical protein